MCRRISEKTPRHNPASAPACPQEGELGLGPAPCYPDFRRIGELTAGTSKAASRPSEPRRLQARVLEKMGGDGRIRTGDPAVYEDPTDPEE
jgi:hypothetical protein